MKTTTTDFVSDAARAALADVIELPAGTLPCRVCGIAVRDGEGLYAEPIVVNKYRPSDGVLAEQSLQGAVMCRACHADEEEALQLIARHRLFYVQTDRLIDMLHALSMLGGPALTFTDDADLTTLLGRMQGASAVPFAGYAKVGTCSARRFSHVDPHLRRSLREGVARWMKVRLEVPVAVAPPASSERRGCLYCGVGSVMALPSQADQVWTECFTSRRALGGGNRASGDVDGHLCGACVAAISDSGATGLGIVGSAGVASIQKALLAFIGYQRTTLAEFELQVPGWGLRAGVKPNATPWAHVDLTSLRASLERFNQGLS